MKLGFKLKKNIITLIKSYYLAKRKQKLYQKERQKKQEIILNNNNPKILLVSHPYNTYDNYIGMPIRKKLQ